jgi:hypothetical protein
MGHITEKLYHMLQESPGLWIWGTQYLRTERLRPAHILSTMAAL